MEPVQCILQVQALNRTSVASSSTTGVFTSMLNLELRFRRYEYFKKHLMCTAGLMSETLGGFL